MTPCEPQHPADPEAFRVPATEIERRTASIQDQLCRAGIDGLFIVQRVDLFYFTGTAQNGFLYMPAEGKPLLFVKQSVARARAESSVETIIAIDSVKTVSALIADVCCRRPARLGLEMDVLPVNEFRFYRDLSSQRTASTARRSSSRFEASNLPGRSPSSKRPPK